MQAGAVVGRVVAGLIAASLVALSPLAAEPQTRRVGPATDVSAGSGALATEFRETVERLPVSLTLAGGQTVTADMLITHFRPAGEGPFPVVVISHGRAGNSRRAEIPRFRYIDWVRFWTRRGFAVLVPTRVGYGEAEQGLDPEAARGPCEHPGFRTAVTNVAAQIKRAVDFAREQRWVDRERIVLVGQSYGGWGTLAASARKPAGVIGAINFAGGLGGRPDIAAGNPCGGSDVTKLAAEHGSATSFPTLWLYAENDRYWGPEWPRKWAMAYGAAGGRAELHVLPAVGRDGHDLRLTAFASWRPIVDDYLGLLGFTKPASTDAPPPTASAPLGEAGRVPNIGDSGRRAYKTFLGRDVPRAFALGGQGAWAWRAGRPDAPQAALEACAAVAKSPCRLYAVDDVVVWPETDGQQAGRAR